MKPKTIYLDYAAATPLDPRVKQAMEPYLEDQFANPSSLYLAARNTRQAIETARAKVANLVGAKKTEIIFTAGGTESINLAIQGAMRQHGGEIVVSAIEHEAVLQTAAVFDRVVVQVKPNGIVDAKAVAAAVTDETTLISLMYANNEIGTIQPIADVAKAVRSIRADRTSRGIEHPLYLHTDACQAAGALDLHVNRLGVDLMTLNGSKIYGPKQTGILYVRAGTKLQPLIYGGGQERSLRSGTENVPGVVGFAVALELAQAERDVEGKRLSAMRDKLAHDLLSMEGVRLNGDPGHRLPNNVNITVDGIDGETAVLYLDNESIQASTGSACTTGGTEPSLVLLAAGCDSTEASASLRFTLGRQSSESDIEQLVAVLPGIIARLRQLKSTTVQ